MPPQMNAMSGDALASDTEGGPMWGRFFDSIGHEDAASNLSGSHHPDLRSLPSIGDMSHLQQSPRSDVHPNDSASVVDDDNGSVLESYARQKGVSLPAGSVPAPVDDGTYVFKFRTPSGRTHRFQSRHDDVEHLRDIIAGKLATDPFFTEFRPSDENAVRPDYNEFILSYTDADGDTVIITSNNDVTDAVVIARSAGTDRVVLYVQGGKGWAETDVEKSEVKSAEPPAPREVKESEKPASSTVVPEITHTPPQPLPQVPRHRETDDVFGIPKDLLLPASIGVLAAVIIGVFTISRLTSSQY